MNGVISDRKSWLRAGAILSAGLALQGCVAMALPALAGGAILRSETSRDDSSDGPGQSISTPDSPAQAPTPTQATNEPSAKLAIASPAPQAGLGPNNLPANADIEVLDNLTELPAPSGAAQIGRIELIYRSGFHQLASYALEQAAKKHGENSRRSALLANPSRLDGERKPCDFGKLAVLIDLDEKGRVFDPASLAPTYDGDAFGHLSRLRESGIKIGWMSALTADKAGSVRKALQVSGLDVEGEDALVLLRYPNDRKQTRRAEFGSSHCLLAIAGDERADFDELYEYLVTPDAAIALEPLIGNGWFLLSEGIPTKPE